MRFVYTGAIAAAIATAIALGGMGGGGGSSFFSGTFDCYGSTPNCTGSGAACTQTISQGTDVAATVSAAAAGSVICLNGSATSYGSVTLSSVSKSSDVIVEPAAGATVTLGLLDFTAVTHVRFSGIGGTMNVAGTNLSTTSSNDTFDHIVYTDCVFINITSGTSDLFDHDRLDNLQGNVNGTQCSHEGRIQVNGADNTQAVTISNSHFGGEPANGYCSDGIQIETGSRNGVQVGPGNEFTGLFESGCNVPPGAGGVTHSDPIQIYTGPPTTTAIVTGNYFHDNNDSSGGLEDFDGSPTGTPNSIVTNNVFVCTCSYPHSIAAWGAQNWQITHNTFAGGGDLSFQDSNESLVAAGNLVENNVFDTGGIQGNTTTYGSNDHNLNIGISGTGDVTCTPTFSTTIATGYYHYQLDPSSPCGYKAGSDGKSMGITP